jgi:hypothetical protein
LCKYASPFAGQSAIARSTRVSARPRPTLPPPSPLLPSFLPPLRLPLPSLLPLPPLLPLPLPLPWAAQTTATSRSSLCHTIRVGELNFKFHIQSQNHAPRGKV